MKPVKKILALILAGVMALALLTGCGKAASLNRTMAEGMGDYLNYVRSHYGNPDPVSVSYQVPELGRNIAPLFDENWVTKNNRGDAVLNENYLVNGSKTVKATLTDILSPYKSAPFVLFLATDVTDVKTPDIETSNLFKSQIGFTLDDNDFDTTSITSMKIEVTHKTVNGRTYALAVMISES